MKIRIKIKNTLAQPPDNYGKIDQYDTATQPMIRYMYFYNTTKHNRRICHLPLTCRPSNPKARETAN